MQKSENGLYTMYVKFHESEYDFIREGARLFTWGRFVKVIRFCIGYAMENSEDFYKWIESQRGK